MINEDQKYDIVHQLNDILNPKTEKELGINRYNEATQTFYVDDDLARQNVRQIYYSDNPKKIIGTFKRKEQPRPRGHLSGQSRSEKKWHSTRN